MRDRRRAVRRAEVARRAELWAAQCGGLHFRVSARDGSNVRPGLSPVFGVGARLWGCVGF